jgi:hypothetical protein
MHALDRINGRLKETGFSCSAGHLKKLAGKRTRGKHYIRIAQLTKWVMTSDGSAGEVVTAIVQDGRVKTVMLSEIMQRWNDGTFSVDLQ